MLAGKNSCASTSSAHRRGGWKVHLSAIMRLSIKTYRNGDIKYLLEEHCPLRSYPRHKSLRDVTFPGEFISHSVLFISGSLILTKFHTIMDR